MAHVWVVKYPQLSQSAQVLKPLPEYFPARQHMHVSASEPTIALLLPAGHEVQSDCPVSAWYRPASQSVHTAAPPALNLPLAQATHEAALVPGAAQAVPAAQGVQPEAPAPLQDPAAHGVQADAPPALKLPAAHAVQAAALAAPVAALA